MVVAPFLGSPFGFLLGISLATLGGLVVFRCTFDCCYEVREGYPRLTLVTFCIGDLFNCFVGKREY